MAGHPGGLALSYGEKTTDAMCIGTLSLLNLPYWRRPARAVPPLFAPRSVGLCR